MRTSRLVKDVLACRREPDDLDHPCPDCADAAAPLARRTQQFERELAEARAELGSAREDNQRLRAALPSLRRALEKNAQTHHDNAETPHGGKFEECQRYACIDARAALAEHYTEPVDDRR